MLRIDLLEDCLVLMVGFSLELIVAYELIVVYELVGYILELIVNFGWGLIEGCELDE